MLYIKTFYWHTTHIFLTMLLCIVRLLSLFMKKLALLCLVHIFKFKDIALGNGNAYIGYMHHMKQIMLLNYVP